MARTMRSLVGVALVTMAAQGWPARRLSGTGFAAPAARAAAAETVLAPGPGALAESVEVTVVNIDVVVRDRTGRRVAGLTRDDFVLLVDGKKAEITNFSGPSGAGAPAPAVTPEARTEAPAAADGAAAAEAAAGRGAGTPGRQPLNVVVCVDNFDLQQFRRNRTLEQVRDFVRRRLQPDDQVMLVSFDPDFHVWHPFRGSAGALGPELDSMLRSMPESEGGDAADDNHFYARLERLVRSLGGLAGRKALFYVGGGRAAGGSVDALHRLTTTANANLVTLYTLEATGLRVHGGADQRLRGDSIEAEQLADWDRQDSLFSMARETGGRVAMNGNDFSQDFAEIAGDLDGAYSLGFAPVHPGDGKIHQIRVEVARPGTRATYRESYRERTADERLEGELTAALVHGFTANPLGATLEISGATPSGHGQVRIAMRLVVPRGNLAFVPGPNGRDGQVSIFVADLDDGLRRVPIQKLQVPLRFAEADFAKALAGSFGYDLTLIVEPGRRRFAVAVRDEVAHVSSTLSEEIEVAGNAAGRAAVKRTGQPGSR
ncbi:MAG TPA: VWA domain-containing protein [Thermoanaerobaculia bacterium]|nr:VWA domain-containing protein [Thermoanaerobaculia bacterium]